MNQNTMRSYDGAMKAFQEWCAKNDVEPILAGYDDFVAFRDSMESDGLSAGTICLRLSALGQWYDDARNVKRPNVPSESRTEALTQEEADAVLMTCKRNTIKGARDYAILMLALYTGLRRAEIVSAKWSDIVRDSRGWALWVNGKGAKLAKIRMPDCVKRALDEYAALSGRNIEAISPLFVATKHNRGEVPLAGKVVADIVKTAAKRAVLLDSPLFVATQHNRGEVPMDDSNVAYIVKRAAKRAGIAKRITPHSLRHTAVTLALDGGAGIYEVQNMMRVHSLDMVAYYDRNKAARGK